MKLRVAALCVVVVLALASIAHWYRLARPTPPASIPRIKWTKAVGNLHPFWSAAVLGSDGVLYLGSTDGTLYAVDASSAERWEYRVDSGDFIAGGLLQDEEHNLYFSTLHKVYSLTSAGRKRWDAECAPPRLVQFSQGATADAERVYATCGGNFCAFDKKDGAQLWKQPMFEGESAAVALDNGAIVFARDRHVVAVDHDGNTMWSYPAEGSGDTGASPGEQIYFNTPVAVGRDGSLYVGARSTYFVALDAQGIQKWTYRTPGLLGGFYSSPVVGADGTVMVLDNHGAVYAFSPDGAVLWRTVVPLKNGPTASPVLGSDGTIYVLADGKVVALSPDGKKKWQIAVPGYAAGSPTLAPDGTLYVATTDGVIYAVQTESQGLMDSPWPKYQHDAGNSGRVSGAKGQ